MADDARMRSHVSFVVRALGALALVALVGCGGAIPRISPGRPPVQAGSFRGYWIWHDEATGWHLRVTTAGQLHRFSGTIQPAEGGSIAALAASRADWGTQVQLVGGVIQFAFEQQGGEDGFDWRVTSGCNTFDLQIDGQSVGSEVHLGGLDHIAGAMPFSRCR